MRRPRSHAPFGQPFPARAMFMLIGWVIVGDDAYDAFNCSRLPPATPRGNSTCDRPADACRTLTERRRGAAHLAGGIAPISCDAHRLDTLGPRRGRGGCGGLDDPAALPDACVQAAVGLAASVVSAPGRRGARRDPTHLVRDGARGVARRRRRRRAFLRGRDPDPGADDLDRGGVTLVDVWTRRSRCCACACTRCCREDWAPHATHLLALETAAVPVLDRIVQDLRHDGRLRSASGAASRRGGAEPVAGRPGFGRVLTADLAARWP